MVAGEFNGDGNDMNRPRFFFDFNLGTIAALGIPLLLSGLYAYNDLSRQVVKLEQRGAGDDRFQTETKVKLETFSDIPIRVKALEEQNKAINSRLDRIADAISAGQEQLRRDLAAQVEPIRKDVQAVGTKVEVLADRLTTRPMPGSFRAK